MPINGITSSPYVNQLLGNLSGPGTSIPTASSGQPDAVTSTSRMPPRIEESTTDAVARPPFGEQIKNAIEHVNTLEKTANELSERVATGSVEDTHRAVIAMERALMSLDLTLQVRNKVIDAYQEIMKTQV